MSDEEKKAFESVKDMFEDVTIKDIDEQSITIYGVAMLDVIKVLNIVEKQQKEIEELKEKNKNMIDFSKLRLSYYDNGKGMQVIIEGFISKNKIKEKIEEYKDYKNTVMYKKYNYEEIIKVLEELLEKE